MKDLTCSDNKLKALDVSKSPHSQPAKEHHFCISIWRPTGERGQWTELIQSLASHLLFGKTFAFFFCHDPENGGFIFDGLDHLYDMLREQGARVVGSPEWHNHDETITDWICKVSPNL